MIKARNIKPEIALYNDRVDGKLLGEHLMSLQTSKSIGNMAGSFTMHFSPTNSENSRFRTHSELVEFIYSAIRPMDMIQIKLTSNEPFFLGIVEKVSESQTLSPTGDVGRSVSVAGRDGGMILDAMPTEFSDELVSGEIIRQVEKMDASGLADLQWNKEELTEFYQLYKGSGGTWTANIVNREPVYVIKNLFEQTAAVKFPVKWESESGDRNYWHHFFAVDDHFLKQWPGDCIQSGAANAKTLSQALKTAIDPNYYWLWLDTVIIDNKPYWAVCMRPKPFDRLSDQLPLLTNESQGWLETNELRTMSISDWEKAYPNDSDIAEFANLTWDRYGVLLDPSVNEWVVEPDNRQLSTSMSNIINTFRAEYTFMLGDPGAPLNRGAVNIASILKYGIRSSKTPITMGNTRHLAMNKRIRELQGELQGDVGVDYWDRIIEDWVTGITTYSEALESDISALKELSKKLQNAHQYRYVHRFMYWNLFNELMTSGTMTLPPNDKIRVGDKVYDPQSPTPLGGKGLYFYVQSVTHNWKAGDGPGTSSTSITVDRGHNDEIRDAYMAMPSIDEMRARVIAQSNAEKGKNTF